MNAITPTWIGDLRKVLDHGFVRLTDTMGSDLSVVRAARTSYDAAWRAGEDEQSDSRLIRYLWKNRHSTPFEAVTFTFEVKAPIFVFRQWHRHRTWSFNELSGRYREMPEEFYVPELDEIGQQSLANKQSRILDCKVPERREKEAERVYEHMESCFALYHDLLKSGWPREVARTVLPLATYSHMFCTVNLLNCLKFLTLRNHSHAQYEIRLYAEAIRDLIRPVVPVCVGAWETHQ